MILLQSDGQNRDNIDFEVSAPAKFVIPYKQPRGYTSIKFTIRIANHTSQPIRFNLYTTLIPELLDSHGQLREKECYRNVFKLPCQEDFPLVMPDENIIFPVMGRVWRLTIPFWKRRLFEKKYKYLYLEVSARDGGHWGFDCLDIGTYQIRFIYQNSLTASDIYHGGRNSTGKVENLGIGEISTLLTTFSLENP